MKQLVYIINNAFKAAVQDLAANKARTFLSLFGITIGIFCMIGVLSAINSLEANIKKDLSTIGSNTLFISKWEWKPSSKDYPAWKMAARPQVNTNDVEVIKANSKLTDEVCYTISIQSSIEKNNNIVSPVNLYATEEAFIKIQDLSLAHGRVITNNEFKQAKEACIIGYENAERLFGNASLAINQTIKINNGELTILGVIKKYGRNILQGWDYDNCVILPFKYYQQKLMTNRVEPFIMAKPISNITLEEYNSELRVIMRAARKLPPSAEDNFSINNISIFTDSIQSITQYVQLGGAVIAFFSLLVGAFGIANIMYVSVKERTKIIGLKKAVGATNNAIKWEFLIESIFLCLLGGLIGIVLLLLSSIFFSKVFGFIILIKPFEIILTIVLCTTIGVLSGYFPAKKAATLNPVTAIRSM